MGTSLADQAAPTQRFAFTTLADIPSLAPFQVGTQAGIAEASMPA